MSQDTVRIEKNVPMPEPGLPKMPFAQMEINDSIEVKLNKPSDKSAIQQRMWRFHKKHSPKRLSMRVIDNNTVRIWRVEDAD